MSESEQKKDPGTAAVRPKRKRGLRTSRKPRKLPPYNVVLLNDNDHSFDYVIEMLRKLFGYPPEKGYQLAEEVDRTGRVILLTTTKEHAEFKREQIHGYGRDTRIASCAGSMSAKIEPAK